jgi:hypothetical protein
LKIWRGLQRKIRHAEDFVPIIEKTEVIEDDKENEVVRVAHFIEQPHQPAHSVREICKSYYPTKVGIQPKTLQMSPLISDVPKGRLHPAQRRRHHEHGQRWTWHDGERPQHDLYEDVTEGSEEHKKLETQHRNGAKMAVHKSIEALRRMGAAGELN